MTGSKIPTPLEFLQAIYINDNLPLLTRMRAAIEAAQYVHPQLKAMAVITGGDFAQRLDRAVARSAKVIEATRVIEARPVEPKPAREPPKPEIKPHLPTCPDRRYRRF